MSDTEHPENDEIDVEVEIEEIEPVSHADEVETPKMRKGMGALPVLALFLLATGLGAVGGAYGAKYLNTGSDAADFQTKLDRAVADAKDDNAKSLAQSISGIQSELSRLKQQNAALKNNAQNSEGIELSQLDAVEARLSERIETVENRPLPSLPEINDETLQALKQAEEDGFDWPDTSAQDTRIAELEEALTSARAEIDGVKSQMLAMESDMADIASKSVTVRPDMADLEANPVTAFKPDFPREALLTAAEAAQEASQNKQGFLAKALNKHIQVREPDDPIVLIETIETALTRGDLKTALKSFDALPQDIRRVAETWRNSQVIEE
jgi:small-conductance mechanosensitive channel